MYRFDALCALTIFSLTLGVGLQAHATTAGCNGDIVCRDEVTRMPLRVVPLVSQPIFARMDSAGPTVGERIATFRPYYVFESIGVSRSGEDRGGWYRVGATMKAPIGYVRATDVREWRLPLVARYSDRVEDGRNRRPVSYFGALRDAEAAVSGTSQPPSLEPDRARSLGIVAREQDTIPRPMPAVTFLPVLQSIDVEAYGIKEGLLLQVALPTRRQAGPKPVVCQTGEADCVQAPSAPIADFFTAPRLHAQSIVAWAANFDLSQQERRALKLLVLLTKRNLQDLSQGIMRLQAEIEIARLDSWLDRGSRRLTERKQEADASGQTMPRIPSKEAMLIEALPSWLPAMPYRSRLTGVTLARLAALDVHAQAELDQRLSDVGKQVRRILASPRPWVNFSEPASSDEQEHLVAFALDDLP